VHRGVHRLSARSSPRLPPPTMCDGERWRRSWRRHLGRGKPEHVAKGWRAHGKGWRPISICVPMGISLGTSHLVTELARYVQPGPLRKGGRPFFDVSVHIGLRTSAHVSQGWPAIPRCGAYPRFGFFWFSSRFGTPWGLGVRFVWVSVGIGLRASHLVTELVRDDQPGRLIRKGWAYLLALD